MPDHVSNAMNLLVLDTALVRCSVGVLAGDRSPLLISQEIGRGHAEHLFGMIAEAMDGAGLAYQALDRIAATVGPGSFTGMRVGIAAARGLALATGAETAGIGTLAAIAARARELAGAEPILATLDARRDEIYAQPFNAAGRPLAPATVGHPAQLLHLAKDGMALAGSGASFVQAEGRGQVNLEIVHAESAPDIGAVVRIAASANADLELKPVYIRAPDAKPQRGAVARQ